MEENAVGDIQTSLPDLAKPEKEIIMATNKPFPEDAQHRRAILVLDQSDRDRLEYEDGGPDLLLNEEIHILEFPVHRSQKILQDIIDKGLAQRGAVLVQSPFNEDSYENATEAEELFALAKHRHFSTFCMHLGAREVRIEEIQRHKASETKAWKVEGGVRIKRVGGSIDAAGKRDEQDECISKLTLVDTFDGGPADPEAAEELLRQTKLLGDPNMSGLLDLRRSGNNQLKSRTLTLNLSSETKRSLSVIGKLEVPPFVGLAGDYKRVVQEQSEYTLTLTVHF